MKNYLGLSESDQKKVLKNIALEILSQGYFFKVDHLKCFAHAYNTTFKVFSGKKVYALRLAVSTSRTFAQMQAEHEWLQSLQRHKQILVPKLVLNKNGESLVLSENNELGKPIPATMTEWSQGTVLGDLGKKKQLEMLPLLGRQMAHLHLQARKMRFSKKAKLQSLHGILWSKENQLTHFWKTHPHLVDRKKQAELNDLVLEATEVLQGYDQKKNHQAIHADLHKWNLIAQGSKLVLLDFDDCGFGHPAWDLAVSLYYWQKEKRFPLFVESLLQSYQEVNDLPFYKSEDLKWMIIARGLFLLNEVVEMKAAGIQEELPQIFERIPQNIKALRLRKDPLY